MRRVEWSESALADLHHVRDYLTEHYGPGFAQWNIDILVLAAEWLLDFPRAGPPLAYRAWRKWKPRKQRHILVYQPDREGILVVRVLHDRNDWRPVSK